MHFNWYEFVGAVGDAAIIITYALLQTEKISSDNVAYSLLNAIGANLIIGFADFQFQSTRFHSRILLGFGQLVGVGKYFVKAKS